MIKFTIITPVLNQVAYLPRTLQSVISQRSSVFELEHIIIDGGSTDGTVEVITAYAQEYPDIVSYISEPDNGVYDAINKGFSRSSGTVVAWLNADDSYCDQVLNRVAGCFSENSECQWLYGFSDIINSSERRIRRLISTYKNFRGRTFSRAKLISENFISQPSVFFRRSIQQQIGPLSTSFTLAADYDYWLRMAERSQPLVLPQVLSRFRWRPDSLSGRNFHRQFTEELAIALRYRNKFPVHAALHRLATLRTRAIYALINRIGDC